jgi:transcription antitermination factor NusA-like protein
MYACLCRRLVSPSLCSLSSQDVANCSPSRNDDASMRLLCPVRFVGAIIGKKGENIRKLRQRTNSNIVVDHSVQNSDERIIRVDSSDALIAVAESICSLQVSSVADEESDDPSLDEEDESSCDIRLLVDMSQVGFLVGKSGSFIKSIINESGAQVHVLPRGELPPCACVSDELIHVSGARDAVTAACKKIAPTLEQHPPKRKGSQKPIILAQASRGDVQFLQKSSARHSTLDYTGSSSVMMDTVFRLLAPAHRAGNIIGRGGDHIQKIRQETGSRIKVYGSADDVEERLVCVFSSEDPSQHYCAAQDALVRCAISLATDDSSSKSNIIRLLAPQVSIGAVLGKKGATVVQLRRETGASVRVLTVEAPLAAAAAVAVGGGEPGGDEIIQIEGALHQCIAALRGVATLLRSWQIRRTITATPRAVTTITLSPGILAESLAMGAAHGGLVAVPVTAHGAGSPAAYATVAHGTYPSSPPVLWRYRLTNVQAGAVIGKNGHHVAQIRQLTGTRVHLPTVPNQSEGLRTLEISGPEESCQAAHTLVNQFLAIGKCSPAMPEHQSNAMVFMEDAEADADLHEWDGHCQWSRPGSDDDATMSVH